VQHGASTLPAECSTRFEGGRVRDPPATNFQNMVYEHAQFPRI
jgi:hypothetical protein